MQTKFKNRDINFMQLTIKEHKNKDYRIFVVQISLI